MLNGWNHYFPHPSSELGPRLKVVTLIDPVIDCATTVLTKKCETLMHSAYEHTRIFKTLEDFFKNRERLPAVIIGSSTRRPSTNVDIGIEQYLKTTS